MSPVIFSDTTLQHDKYLTCWGWSSRDHPLRIKFVPCVTFVHCKVFPFLEGAEQLEVGNKNLTLTLGFQPEYSGCNHTFFRTDIQWNLIIIMSNQILAKWLSASKNALSKQSLSLSKFECVKKPLWIPTGFKGPRPPRKGPIAGQNESTWVPLGWPTKSGPTGRVNDSAGVIRNGADIVSLFYPPFINSP